MTVLIFKILFFKLIFVLRHGGGRFLDLKKETPD
jgi:hypothetical protein